eukprot:scaffold118341_cov63-Phaeocystis_antarctica.AAC.7
MQCTCSAPLVYMQVHLMVRGDDKHALPLRAGVALHTDGPRCAGPTGDKGSGNRRLARALGASTGCPVAKLLSHGVPCHSRPPSAPRGGTEAEAGHCQGVLTELCGLEQRNLHVREIRARCGRSGARRGGRVGGRPPHKGRGGGARHLQGSRRLLGRLCSSEGQATGRR